MSNQRFGVALLVLSGFGLGGIALKEGFTEKPIIPTRGDVPTIGHGTTVYPDGTHVQNNDKPINRETALYYLKDHVQKDELSLKKSLAGVKLTQNEYDSYVDFIYQYGSATFHKSSMRKYLLKGEYNKACNAMLKYKYVAKRDCSIRSNKCYGVWNRQKERVKKCLS